MALPFLIRAAVVDGVATATEVSTVGIGYTILAGLLLYRRAPWRRVYPMLVDTAALAGAILLIIGMATAMAWALTQSGFSQQLVSAMMAVPGGKAGFMAVSVVAFALLGSVLEGIPAIVLLGPLLFPAARALGVHDVHYAMTVVLAMGLGLFAPPFGVGVLFLLRHWRCDAGRGMGPGVALSRRLAGGGHPRGGRALAVHRVPVAMDTLATLRLFQQVVERGSISGAGRALGLSATAASRQMQELEAALKARLLYRTTRSVCATEAGQHLFDRVGPLLEDLDGALRSAGDEHGQPAGTLRVVARRSFGILHVAPAIAGFHARFPHVSVELTLTEMMDLRPSSGVDVVIRLGRPDEKSLMSTPPGRRSPGAVREPGLPRPLRAACHPGRLRTARLPRLSPGIRTGALGL